MEDDSEGQIAARYAAQILQGSEVAEAALVKRYSRGLFYLLRNKVRDTETARDLCQDTLYIAIEKLRKEPLTEPGKLSHWLARIANNLAANYIRKESRRQTYPDEQLAQKVIDTALGPEEQLSHAESIELVRELVEEMKLERDRDVLRRVLQLDQDKEQIIAGVEGLKNAADFHRVMNRAKARLRNLVRQRVGDGYFPYSARERE